ncbi:hypothetical protein HZC21_03285 [Candidatus Peregrinibacteria bacterium]|nr:hypothetical protein [Candidatus Peregrinibacteria bacterium]
MAEEVKQTQNSAEAHTQPAAQTAAAQSSTQPAAQTAAQPATEQVEAYNLNASSASKTKTSFLEKLISASDKDSKGGGNIFTKLFRKGSKLSVASRSVSPMPQTAPQLSALLGPKPQFSARAYEEAEKERRHTAKTLFQFSLLIAVAVYGYFYSQLSPNFTWFTDQLGPNAIVSFESTNNEIQKQQADLNVFRYRMARLWLDEVNWKIDAFQEQKTSAKGKRAAAEKEFIVLKDNIKKDLSEAKKILSAPLGIDTFSLRPITAEERETTYEQLLKEKLSSQKSALLREKEPNQAEIMLLDNVIRLIENKPFLNLITRADLEKISDDDLAALLSKIRDEGTDELSSIHKIRNKRLDWGAVLADIYNVTRKADQYYGQGYFNTVGGFMFSTYKFDSATGRITVGGATKTSDSKTFSFIAKLIESIERSPKFKDIDFRSFSKSKDEKGDFSSSINLEFSIQTGVDPRDDADSALTKS